MTLAFRHALSRGAFMVALARTEAAGVPLDHGTLTTIRDARDRAPAYCAARCQSGVGVLGAGAPGRPARLQAGAGRGLDRAPRLGVAEAHADRAPESRQGRPRRGRARAARGRALRGRAPSHERAPARVPRGRSRWAESGHALPVRHDHGPECAVEQPVHLRPAAVAPASDSSPAGARARLHGLVGAGVRRDGGLVPRRGPARRLPERRSLPRAGHSVWDGAGGGHEGHARGDPRSLQAGDARDQLRDGRPVAPGEAPGAARRGPAPPRAPPRAPPDLLALERSRRRSRPPPPPALHPVRVAALGALGHGAVGTHPPELAGPEHGGRDDARRPRRALAGRRPGRRRDPRRLPDRGGGRPDPGRHHDHPTGDGRGEPAGAARRPHPAVGRPGDPAGGPVPAEYRGRHLGLGARAPRPPGGRGWCVTRKPERSRWCVTMVAHTYLSAFFYLP